MVSGEKFNGPVELRQLLLKRKDLYARNVTEKMFAYALNRGLEPYDIPIVKHTVKKLSENEYRIGVLVQEIVQSYPFRYRRGASPLVSQH